MHLPVFSIDRNKIGCYDFVRMIKLWNFLPPLLKLRVVCSLLRFLSLSHFPKICHSTNYYVELLGWWDYRIVDIEFDVSSISCFILFIELGHSKLFIFIFVILWKKNKKINWQDFCKEFARNHEKNDTWNIRRLVDNSFVPSSKWPSVYCKLTEFWSMGQLTQLPSLLYWRLSDFRF